ncbi:MAG: uracil-DNA glycosylase [Myxococcales bacterium]|nr:uracil-DNA glycosylase [Myxococcales bacterium]
MADADRDELAALVRGWTAHFEWGRESGAIALRRRGGASLPTAGEAPRVAAPVETPRVPAAVEAPSPAPVAHVVAPQPPRAPPIVEVAKPSPAPTPPAQAETRPLFEEPRRTFAPVVYAEERARLLTVVEDQARECRSCRLCEGRNQSVFARGSTNAELFFVGEAPGADEDRIGKPFVGAAGKLLDRILAAMKMSEDDVYIANVIKCRPPNNRPPEPDEAAACGPFLERQIELLRPKVIVAWGRTPTSFLLKKTESMTRLRGRWHEYMGIPVLVTWHPAYLLRNPDAKKDTWADMKLVLEKLGRPAPTGRA